MTTERQPKRQPSDNRGSKGISFIERPGRPNPHGVQWPVITFDPITGERKRKRETEFFPSIEARETKAREIRDARRGRMLVSSVSRQEAEDFRAFKAAIGDTPWQNVVAGWRSHLMVAGILPCSLTVEAAAKIYLDRADRLLEREKISKGHHGHVKKKIALFVDQFGDLHLDRVKAQDIETWIDDFDVIESDFTFDNYVKHIRAFFGYFVEEKTIRENPASRIEHRSDGIGEVGTISVAQTAQLMFTCMTDERLKVIIGRIAMEAFVGLRFGSGCRLAKEDINRADKGITLPKHKLKTKRRHYIDGVPDCVWSWIDITPDECWDVTPRQYLELKSELFTVACVPHPHNCLRHDFCTYHIAAYKNAGLTAYILCHRNQDQLYDHYLGRATEAEGKLYQTITPETAPRLAVGFAPVRSATGQGGR